MGAELLGEAMVGGRFSLVCSAKLGELGIAQKRPFFFLFGSDSVCYALARHSYSYS